MDSHIEQLIRLLAKLPGLGPRSARRAALYLIKRADSLLAPLARAMIEAAERIQACSTCGNLDGSNPCAICADARRDTSTICVVEDVADLWALERAAMYRGTYHVLGGALSALDGIGPEDLNIPALASRVRAGGVSEVIFATSATVEGQITAHYIAEIIEESGVTITGLALGVPMGGELDYLDEGTLNAAMKARRAV